MCRPPSTSLYSCRTVYTQNTTCGAHSTYRNLCIYIGYTTKVQLCMPHTLIPYTVRCAKQSSSKAASLSFTFPRTTWAWSSRRQDSTRVQRGRVSKHRSRALSSCAEGRNRHKRGPKQRHQENSGSGRNHDAENCLLWRS